MTRADWIRGGCGAAAFLMAAALFVGAETAVEVPLPPTLDKFVHFLYYGLMAGLLAHAVGRRWLWVPLILVPVIGAADEWNQSLIVGRDASFWDWLADEAGTVVAVGVYWYGCLRRRAEVRGPRFEGRVASEKPKSELKGQLRTERGQTARRLRRRVDGVK